MEYYRAKITEYDGEYENLVKRLQKYKSAYEHMVVIITLVLMFWSTMILFFSIKVTGRFAKEKMK